MKNVLCYGDSNTWGAVPVATWDTGGRFSFAQRWPGVLQSDLGSDWQVIEEGLPGRTTVVEDPIDGAHLSGLPYLKPCLLSHKPLDHVIIFLGTNDLKRRLNLIAEDVCAGIDRLLREVKFTEALATDMSHVLVICPPPLKEVGLFEDMFAGARAKSLELASLMQDVARQHDASFLDSGSIISASDIDGIHYDADQHVLLGQAVAKIIAQKG